MRSGSRRVVWFAILLGAVSGAFFLGRVYPDQPAPAPADAAAPAYAAPAAAPAGGAAALSGLPDFREVARKVVPAVVTVRSQKTVRVSQQPQSPFGGSPFGDDFFEQFFGPPRRGAPREQRFVQRGLGSGVIVSTDGYVLTNNHVVEGVDKVEVVTDDGKTRPAKIVGTDPQTDIAVLKVDGSGLTAIEMGDSGELDVGEWVLAVGNPFSEALGHSVTAGIVSAKGRSNLHLADYEDFIQTDAAINPGNSGGALVNTAGQLVGINAAIITRSGGYQGIGFAIPINMARGVMDHLVKEGRVVRGWIGVTIQDLTPELAEGMGIAGREGALVTEIQSGSPASEAGLRRGDAIVAVDGKGVTSNATLRNRIAATAPGTKVTLTVIRDGDEKRVAVTLGELPGSRRRAAAGGAPEAERALGIGVQPLSRDLAAQLGYEGDTGVVVSDVEQGSPAEEAGLQPGDLIKEVNRRPVAGIADYREAMDAVRPGKVVLLLVRRGEAVTYVTLRP